MYNGPYLVLFSPVLQSIQDVEPKERTIKVSVAIMVFPHLPWQFDMTFRSLILNCSSNSLGESTRGSEKSNFFYRTIIWLASSVMVTSGLQNLCRVCRSQYLTLIDLIESVDIVHVLFQRLMISERRR